MQDTSKLTDHHTDFLIMRFLKEVLLRETSFIVRHAHDYPQAFFQCCWNMTDWSDESRANEETGTGRLKKLLLSWREERQKQYPEQRWIRRTLPPQNPLGGPLLSQVSVVKRPSRSAVLSGQVVCFAVSAGGDRLLTVTERGSSRINYIDLRNNALIAVLESVNTCVENGVDPHRIGRIGITSLAFSPDGKEAVSGSQHGTVRLWSLERGEIVYENVDLPHSTSGTEVRFSPDGQFILAVVKIRENFEDPDNKTLFLMRVYEKKTGTEVLNIEKFQDIADFSFSPGSDSILLLSKEGEQLTHRFLEQKPEEKSISRKTFLHFFNPAERTLMITESTGAPRTVSLLNKPFDETAFTLPASAQLNEGKEETTAERIDTITEETLSPDGMLFALGESAFDRYTGMYLGSRILLFSTVNGEMTGFFSGHHDTLTGIAFSDDGKRLHSSSQDGTVCSWDTTRSPTVISSPDPNSTSPFYTQNCPEYMHNPVHPSIKIDTAETEDGEYLVILNDSGTGETITQLEHTFPYDFFEPRWSFSADEKRIALYNDEDNCDDPRFREVVTVWDTRNGKLLDSYPPGTELNAAVSEEGTYPFIAVEDERETRIIGRRDRKVYGFMPPLETSYNQRLLSEILVPEPSSPVKNHPKKKADDTQQMRIARLLEYYDNQREMKRELTKRSESFASEFDLHSGPQPSNRKKKKKEISLDDL